MKFEIRNPKFEIRTSFSEIRNSKFGVAVFVSLIGLIIFTAVPYGTVEPWWRAFFICSVLAICILALIEGFLSGNWHTGGRAVLLPLFAISVFALLQTVPLNPLPVPNASYSSWNAISADPYGTQFFAIQLLALTLAAALLFRYVSNERRLDILIQVIIGLVVVSAIFGILRQTTQNSLGFGLPLLRPGRGYGQFVNKNHFTLLMEMGLGLALGMIVAGGVTRERVLIYFAALLPIWTALVLSNSRGGLLAMLAQLIACALLFTSAVPASTATSARLKVLSVARMLPVRVLLLVVLVVGVAVGTAWVGGDQLAARLEYRDPSEPSAVTRKDIWRATWMMFKTHPIAGMGIGAYWVANPEYHQGSGVLGPKQAHNEYLEILSSGGLIGAALTAWFCIVLLARTRANLKSKNRLRRAACFGAALGIVGVAVHSLFDFGLHMMANALVFLVLVVIATKEDITVRDVS